MAEERGTLRSVAWLQVFPALHIFSAVRMALNLKALLLAAIAVSGTVAGWRVFDQLFSGDRAPMTIAMTEHYNVWPWQRPIDSSPASQFTSLETWYLHSPLVAAWGELSVPFRRMYDMHETPTFTNFMYLLCCALWSLIVWSFFGGAISRQAAVSFARQENVSLGGLIRFVNPRLGSYFVAPLFPMLGAGLIALMMAGVGALMRFDFGVAVAGTVLWPFVLFGGFLMAFLLLGLFFGFPLMWSAISAEGTDAFGALSHALSYVYQRPLRYLGYAIVAGLAGVLGWYLVTLFGFWILELAHWGISWGSSTERLREIEGPASLSRIADTGAVFMHFWTNCLLTLAYGFVFSYFWTSTTIIYFLLRRLVDAKELDEVYMADEQARLGLPPLKTGPDGIPAVADEPNGTDG
jgi:hypothetical protein